MDWISFFFAVSHSEADYLEETMKGYDIGSYIMAMETCEKHTATKGQHFHFCVEMDAETYHKFSKRVFTKYKLCGTSKGGKTRQYGKVDKIRNIELMKQYCVKEADTANIRTNLSQEDIALLIEKSYKKAESSSTEAEILLYLGKIDLLKWIDIQQYHLHEQLELNYSNCALNYDCLVAGVIRFHLEKDKRVPPPSSIKCFVKNFICECNLPHEYKCKLLQKLMDIRNPFITY